MNIKRVTLSGLQISRKMDYGTTEQQLAVEDILKRVQNDGDRAIVELTKEHDHYDLQEFRVTDSEIDEAYDNVNKEFIDALKQASHNIREFHEKQKRLSWMDLQPDGSLLGQVIRPLERVGLYVPGGKAAYPSSVLMNVIPAQVAGVKEMAITTPPATAGVPGINASILVAAAELGVREIYKVGGAQAIAALAFGTESIPSVDKICGPGNIYVALAKRSVYGQVDIDSIAGPTDIAILADETADPAYIAADMLSQAEHDEMAAARLITMSSQLADEVEQELAKQLALLPRKQVAETSLEQNGLIVLAEDLQEGIAAVNKLAPEHLEIMVEQPLDILSQIEHAGAIFLGSYSAEPVGDYFAGPNHILPTNGTARFSSPLNVDDFLKKSSVIYYSKQALLTHGDAIMTLARQEGFEGHARAIQARIDKERNDNA